ncbi:LIC_10190 family membrane protein [Chryseobacterium sp. 6424]|uniref:LIC_10190 family membrane protein n=1 Tax=Chryseobacterium sp. 6424 TaxID=2039166 RepID=UPI001E5C9384|nr:hypothetical protein [Chryseobacterium sp. 6424]
MLYLIFTMLLLFPVLLGFGALVQLRCREKDDSISGTLLRGIFIVALSWTLIAFVAPLNEFLELIYLIAGGACFMYFKGYRAVSQLWSNAGILLPISFLILLFFGAGFPFILDHFGYYVPTIKWLTQFGMVKGIANLDLVIGQMSIWHIFQAGFSHFSDSFLRINVLAAGVFLIYIFEKKCWIHLFFLPILFLFVQSPSPDLPAIVFSLILLQEILHGNRSYTWLFAFAVFVFCLKPTVVWLPIFVFGYMFLHKKWGLPHLIPGLLVLLIFVLKNSWVFGYPFFPVQMFDFGLSWKPHPAILQDSAEMAMMKTYDLQYTFAEISGFSLSETVIKWLFLPGIKGFIHISLILSLVVFFVFCLRSKSTIHRFLMVTILVKVALVLTFSAQYRFFLDVFFVIGFVMFHHLISKKLAFFVFLGFSLLVGVFFSFPKLVINIFPTFRLGSFMTGAQADQWLKPRIFELNEFKTHQIGNLQFHVVQGYPFSFDTPLPAISPLYLQQNLNAGIFPQLIGEGLQQGFVWRAMSPQEKKQLQQIIQQFNSGQ